MLLFLAGIGTAFVASVIVLVILVLRAPVLDDGTLPSNLGWRERARL